MHSKIIKNNIVCFEGIEKKCYYINDKIEGKYKEWYEMGGLYKTSYYKDGILIN